MSPVNRGVRELGGAAVVAALALLVLAVSGALGLLLMTPWLFPSMGPTVMLMLESPENPSARPLNAAVGHAVGIAVGIGCLLLFGLEGLPSAPAGGLTWGYVLAGALSVAVTMLLLRLVRLPHPPAGATTLIVSLGVIATPQGILSMAGALALTIAACAVLVRLLPRRSG